MLTNQGDIGMKELERQNILTAVELDLMNHKTAMKLLTQLHANHRPQNENNHRRNKRGNFSLLF